MKNKQIQRINTGTTSLILVISVLALVTFGVLSLSAAQTQKKLSEKMEERMNDYYSADRSAVEKTEVLNRLFKETAVASSTQEVYLKEVERCIREKNPTENGGNADAVSWNNGTVEWKTAVTDTQSISVSLQPLYKPNEDGLYYEIMSWQLTTDKKWKSKQKLELFSGNGQ